MTRTYETTTGIQYRFRHAGHLEKIVQSASNVLGEDQEFISWLMNSYCSLRYYPSEEPLARIEVQEWLRISEFLGISVDSYQNGYCQIIHFRELYKKIKSGRYFFPKGRKYQVIKRRMKRERSHEITFEKEHYGTRLYFRLRLKEWIESFKAFPNVLKNQIKARIFFVLARLTYGQMAAIQGEGMPFSDNRLPKLQSFDAEQSDDRLQQNI